MPTDADWRGGPLAGRLGRGTPVGLRPPSVPPTPERFNVCLNGDCLVFSTVTYLLALYSNKRGGKCLSYVGTEGNGRSAFA